MDTGAWQAIQSMGFAKELDMIQQLNNINSIINIPKALMNNIYSMQKQMGDISRKILGKNQKEMVKIKKQKQKNIVN